MSYLAHQILSVMNAKQFYTERIQQLQVMSTVTKCNLSVTGSYIWKKKIFLWLPKILLLLLSLRSCERLNLTASNDFKSMMQTIKYSRSFKTTQQLIPNHSCIYGNDIRKKTKFKQNNANVL